MQLSCQENSLAQTPTDQLKQENLNWQQVIPWSKTLTTGFPINFVDSATTNVSTNVQTYNPIPGFAFNFTASSGMMNYVVKLNLSTTSNASIGIYVDNNIIDEYFTGVPNMHTLTCVGNQLVSVNASHSFSVMWRMINSGTMTKYSSGNSRVQITNLILT